MTHHELRRKLGETAGIELELSGVSIAAAKFDGDEVNFESDGERLYIYADIAPAPQPGFDHLPGGQFMQV